MTLPATDDFSVDADPLDGNWVSITGTDYLKALSGLCVINTVSSGNYIDFWNSDVFNNDQYSIVKGVVGYSLGPAVRCSANNCYFIVYNKYQQDLFKIVAGTFTLIKSYYSNISEGDDLKLAVSGVTLEFFKNGVSIGTKDDSDLASGSPGLILHGDKWSGNGISAWEGGNIGGQYSVNCSAGFSVTVGLGEIGNFPEIAAAGLSLAVSSSEVADFVRSAVVQMGIAAGETEKGEFPESSSVIIGLHGQSTGIVGMVKVSSATFNLQAVAGEIANFVESLDPNLGLAAAVSEIADFAKSFSSGISISVSISESADFIEGVSVGLSFSPAVVGSISPPTVFSVSAAVNILFSAIAAYQSEELAGIIHFKAEDIAYRIVAKSKRFHFVAKA